MGNTSAATITRYMMRRDTISILTTVFGTLSFDAPATAAVECQQQEDMVRSYILMYEQSGWLPTFPSVDGDQAVMIGHHAAEFILIPMPRATGTSMLRKRIRRFERTPRKELCFPGTMDH